MNSNQNPKHEMLENYFRKIQKPKRTLIIERLLPSNAVLFLFEHSRALRIEMLAEKRSKDDYVMIEIEENNQRVYVFQLLLDALRIRFISTGAALFLSGLQDRRISELMAKLKAL